MLAAFSLLVFSTHVFDFELKGLFRDAFAAWTTLVRPFVGHPTQWLVDQLPEAWRFEVPSVAKDYFATAGVLMLSWVRAIARELSKPGFAARHPLDAAAVLQLLRLLVLCLALSLMWPLTMLAILDAVFERNADWPAAKILISWIWPLAYLGLLFAANVWLA